ncbi:hypothetical protein GCM10012275_28100 [Longimycelium tulufanense]|uniref:Uncharacterized protein n=1 Tax=Longimycelium tulufanense TaxID=907463 RepID=A0A8J3C8K8_9PSEU|nr:hypothetical protein [Longimycelium tulufanense]GGM55329.1 hypothetical protein GCM10012275_28100 [Longimycelium tulufanense]
MEPLHPHRVSYYRIVKGSRHLVATEDVDDYGFYLGWERGEPVTRPAKDYACGLLDEHLDRGVLLPRLTSGERWYITVHRIMPDGSRRLLCEVGANAVVDDGGIVSVSPSGQPATSRRRSA